MTAAVMGTAAANNGGGNTSITPSFPPGNWAANGVSVIPVGHCIFGSSLFIAASDTVVGNVATSPDGVTWTNRAAVAGAGSTPIVDAKGPVYCAVGTDSNVFALATSTNGTTWTDRTSALPSKPATGNLSPSVGYDSSTGTTLVVGSDGTTLFVWKSTDGAGATWTRITGPAGTGAYSIATDNNGTWIVGSQTDLFRSTDGGANWSSTVLSLNFFLQGHVWYANGRWLALAFDLTVSPKVLKSYESFDGGQSWQLSASWAPASSFIVRHVEYVNGIFIGIGQIGTGEVVFYSGDGLSWTITTLTNGAFTGNQAFLSGVAFGAGKYLFSGRLGGPTYSTTDPTLVATGMLLCVTVRGGTGTTITDPPSPWVLIGSQVNSTTVLAQKLYWHPLDPTNVANWQVTPAITITSNKASSVGVMLSGTDPTAQPSASTEYAGQANASSLTVTYPAIGTFTLEAGIDLAFGGNANADTTVAPASYTNGSSSSSTSGSASTRTTSGVAYRSLPLGTSVGSLTAAWTGTAAVNIGQHVFARELPPSKKGLFVGQAVKRAVAR